MLINKKINLAQNDDELRQCFEVMSELRPHISPEEFLPQVKRQFEIAGYRLAYLTDGEVKAVAGFRISEWLATGKYLCVEDLVAKESERSKGYGGALFDWLVQYAAENDCRQIQLVSRISRLDAHRFYLRKGMNIEAHYFSFDLK